MAEKFDEVVEVFAREHCKDKLKKNLDDAEKEYLLKIVREETTREVMNEIRAELKSEIEQEVKSEIEEQGRLNRLSNLKKLIADGFTLAVFVGLLVNQLTEIIDYYKGSDSELPIGITWMISLVLSVICGIILLAGFAKEFIKMYNAYTKGRNNHEND